MSANENGRRLVIGGLAAGAAIFVLDRVWPRTDDSKSAAAQLDASSSRPSVKPNRPPSPEEAVVENSKLFARALFTHDAKTFLELAHPDLRKQFAGPNGTQTLNNILDAYVNCGDIEFVGKPDLIEDQTQDIKRVSLKFNKQCVLKETPLVKSSTAMSITIQNWHVSGKDYAPLIFYTQ